MVENAPKVIFGGTFDPVHYGHLRTALELADWLECPVIDLVPAKDPVHRPSPGATAMERLTMLEMSCSHEDRLSVNPIEIESSRESYTLLTLKELRNRIGNATPLILVMGMDAFKGIRSWHGWDQLLSIAHLLVVHRSGYHPHLDTELQSFVDQHITADKEDLETSPSGRLIFHELTPLGISATAIRDQIQRGDSPRFLLPDSVWNFIQQKRLYGFKTRDKQGTF